MEFAQLINPSVYVEEVNRLFGLTEEKYRGYNRWRYCDDCGLDWTAINSGMENIVATLREQLAAGEHAVVVPPVVAFYHQLAEHVEEFMEEEEVSLDSAARACDLLLLAWVEHPGIPLNEKQEVYQTLQGLAETEIMDYVDGLSDAFFINFLTRMLSPQAALDHIEKQVAEGNTSEAQTLRHISLLRQLGRDADALLVIRRNLRYHSVLDAVWSLWLASMPKNMIFPRFIRRWNRLVITF